MSNKNATAATAGKAGEKDARARRSTVRRMLGLFSAHPAKLAATFALVVAVVVCTLALPTLSGRAVDCVVGPGEVDFAGLTVGPCRRHQPPLLRRGLRPAPPGLRPHPGDAAFLH